MSASDEVRRLIQDTKELERAIDINANLLADLLERNLEFVSGYRLSRIKRKLARFNSTTRKWKPWPTP